MARKCTICEHPRVRQIDMALLGSDGYRTVARHFAVSPSAVWRHRRYHIPELIAEGLKLLPAVSDGTAPPQASADSMAAQQQAGSHPLTARQQYAIETVQQIKAINSASLEVLREAREKKQYAVVLRAVDRVARQIELDVRVHGKLEELPEGFSVTSLPEWTQLRATILRALKPFPEARQAVVEALRGAGA